MRHRLVGIAWGLVCALACAATASAQPQLRGRWSAPFDMGAVSIHATLLRGPQDAWRVTWWSGFDGNKLHSWDYVPGPVDSVTSFTSRAIPVTPDNFYECGFTTTAGGRLLSAGGLVHYHNDGSKRAVSYDPLTRASTPQTPLGVERYEPSLTALADGRVLVSGGIRYIYSVGFGGRVPRPGAPLEREARADLLRLALHPVPEWRDSTEDGWGSTRRPPPLEQHSAVFDAAGVARMLVFGGHDATAPLGPEVVNDRVWQLKRYDEDHTREVVWTWDTLATIADPTFGRPAGRWAHGAILTPDRRMIVFGGRTPAGVLGDTWELSLAVPFGASAPWRRLVPVADPTFGVPSARWGHAVILDAAANRMLVFGGRDLAGLAADDCWELSLGATPAWNRLAPSGVPREGHSAVFGTVGYPRVWLFGGRGASGMRNDVLEFRLDTGTWRTPTLVTGSPVPPARADHAAFLGGDDWMTISGGELADGSLDDRVWRLRFLNTFFEPTQLAWVLDPAASAGPGPRAGHTLVPEDDLVTSRRFEVYDPEGSTGGSPGATQELPASARHFVYFYPSMLVLPGGHVFHASGTNTAVLDLASATWTAVAGGVPGGTAGQVVHYAPGRVMRCGGSSRSGATDVIAFDANDQTTGWTNWTLGQMQPRILHRATILPTGEVLLTGGVRDGADTQGVRIPQVWNVTAGWGDPGTLDPEPVQRSYHSVALLLPDGRVFTAGGSTFDASPYKACVYEPPYLFDAGGALVRQTEIGGAPAAATYGATLTLGTSVTEDAAAITAACLIRPSAVSHDPNFEQRRVPLALVHTGDSLAITLPAAPGVAPPGDYMLFLLRDMAGVSVPSIARWLRLLPADGIAPGIPARFRAMRLGADLQLSWAPRQESDLAGYRLYRGDSPGFVAGPANRIAETSDTIHVDAAAPVAWYKLSAVDQTGNESGFALLGPDDVLGVPPSGAARVSFAPPWPNPAHEPVRLEFTLARAGTARITVHDPAGRIVRTLGPLDALAGPNVVVWDRRDGDGRALPAGRYWLRLTAEGQERTRPVLLTR